MNSVRGFNNSEPTFLIDDLQYSTRCLLSRDACVYIRVRVV